VLPDSIRVLFLGAGAKVVALATTRHMLLWALAVFLVLAMLAWAVPRVQRWPVAALTLLAAFTFFGGYERLREGSRKPFVIRDVLFSNGIAVADIGKLDERGVLAQAQWAAREDDGTVIGKGRAVFRAECAACHTIDGYMSIRTRIAPVDADMLQGILATMREEGQEYVKGTYTHEGHVATQNLDYPFMPPLVGTDAEVEALAAYLMSLKPAQVSGGAQ
jgi:mono/diheme cytochrome c family protein